MQKSCIYPTIISGIFRCRKRLISGPVGTSYADNASRPWGQKQSFRKAVLPVNPLLPGANIILVPGGNLTLHQ
jgi:hypothetical protein